MARGFMQHVPGYSLAFILRAPDLTSESASCIISHVATWTHATPEASHGKSDARIVLLAKNWPPALLNTFRVRARETPLRARALAPQARSLPVDLTHAPR